MASAAARVPADHNNLLGMFTAGNFADDVGAFDGTACEFVLNVDVNANGFAFGEIAFDLAFVFATDGEDRSFDINAEAEDAGVGEVHAFGLEAEITANDGNCTCLIDAPKKLGILAEHLPEILLGRALRNDKNDFAAEFRGIFHFGWHVEDIRGGHIGVNTAGGRGAGPTHGGNRERAMQGSEHLRFGDATRPAFPELPFFRVDVF